MHDMFCCNRKVTDAIFFSDKEISDYQVLKSLIFSSFSFHSFERAVFLLLLKRVPLTLPRSRSL